MFGDLLDEVDEFVSRDLYAKAFKFVRNAIRREGRSHKLLYSLAYIHLCKGWEYWKNGEFAYETGDVKRAVYYSRKALKLNPGCPATRLLLADALLRSRKDRAARLIYRGIVGQGVSSLAAGPCGEGLPAAKVYLAEALYGIANSYDLEDDADRAVPAFEECIAFMRENNVRGTRRSLREIRLELKDARDRTGTPRRTTIAGLMDGGDYGEALKQVRREIREYGKTHYLLATLSEINFEKGRFRLALETAEEAGRIAGRCPLVRLARGKALAAVGREEEAVAVLKGLVSQDLHSLATGRCGEGVRSSRTFKADALLNIARIYRMSGNPAEALYWYRRCITYRRMNRRKMARNRVPLRAAIKEMREVARSHLCGDTAEKTRKPRNGTLDNEGNRAKPPCRPDLVAARKRLPGQGSSSKRG